MKVIPPKDKKDEKEQEDPNKIEDKNRSFLNKMRPPLVWNFFEEDDSKTPHLLRADAAPKQCYIDKRVDSILQDIEDYGISLRMHEAEIWNRLMKLTVAIFEVQDKKELEEAGGNN